MESFRKLIHNRVIKNHINYYIAKQKEVNYLIYKICKYDDIHDVNWILSNNFVNLFIYKFKQIKKQQTLIEKQQKNQQSSDYLVLTEQSIPLIVRSIKDESLLEEIMKYYGESLFYTYKCLVESAAHGNLELFEKFIQYTKNSNVSSECDLSIALNHALLGDHFELSSYLLENSVCNQFICRSIDTDNIGLLTSKNGDNWFELFTKCYKWWSMEQKSAILRKGQLRYIEYHIENMPPFAKEKQLQSLVYHRSIEVVKAVFKRFNISPAPFENVPMKDAGIYDQQVESYLLLIGNRMKPTTKIAPIKEMLRIELDSAIANCNVEVASTIASLLVNHCNFRLPLPTIESCVTHNYSFRTYDSEKRTRLLKAIIPYLFEGWESYHSSHVLLLAVIKAFQHSNIETLEYFREFIKTEDLFKYYPGRQYPIRTMRWVLENYPKYFQKEIDRYQFYPLFNYNDIRWLVKVMNECWGANKSYDLTSFGTKIIVGLVNHNHLDFLKEIKPYLNSFISLGASQYISHCNTTEMIQWFINSGFIGDGYYQFLTLPFRMNYVGPEHLTPDTISRSLIYDIFQKDPSVFKPAIDRYALDIFNLDYIKNTIQTGQVTSFEIIYKLKHTELKEHYNDFIKLATQYKSYSILNLLANYK